MNGLNWGMTLFIIILSYAVSIGARLMIKLTFLKYDDIETAKKISGAEAARAVLDGRGLSYVSVERIRSIEPLIRLGTVLFIVMAVFQAVMFISEADAGKRAIASLRQENILDDSELEGAQKVIRTASLVYAAALASLLASLVRMMTGANNK